jgi:nucleoid DNA-binding protein
MTKDKTAQIIKEIAIEGGLDPATVRSVYVALIRYVLKTMKTKGLCPLPDFGVFRIKKYAERIIIGVRSREAEKIPSTKVIKFDPDYKLKRYIKEKFY